MINFNFLLLVFYLFFTACAGTVEHNNAKNIQALIETDSAFSKLSEEKGMKAAFIAYAAEDVIKPAEGKFPVIGKPALIKSLESDTQNFTLTWQPIKAEVSSGNDLGYTFGNWKIITTSKTDSIHTYYGNYISIWKKQADGAWKYVFDTGNSTPKPLN
jgi:ketosteroid isomerase-like protein